MNIASEGDEETSLPNTFPPLPPPYKPRNPVNSSENEDNLMRGRTYEDQDDDKEDDDLGAPETLVSSLGSFDDVRTGKALLTLHSVLNFLAFPLYMVFVASKYRFPYGYVNPDSASYPPGIFVDQRFDFFGVVLFLSCNRWINYYFYSWITDSRVYSWWLFTFQRIFATVFFVYDLFYLLVLLVLGLSCNSSFFPSNPCNDPDRYCLAFGNDYPSLCPKNSYDPSYDSNYLVPNVTFRVDFWFSVGFAASDLIILLAAPSFRLTMRRFLMVNYSYPSSSNKPPMRGTEVLRRNGSTYRTPNGVSMGNYPSNAPYS